MTAGELTRRVRDERDVRRGWEEGLAEHGALGLHPLAVVGVVQPRRSTVRVCHLGGA